MVTLTLKYFPSGPGIRWWQYSSNPYDKNIVLLDDEESKPKWKKMILDGGMNTLTGSYPKKFEKSVEPGIILMVQDICLKTSGERKHSDGKWYYLDPSGAMATGWKENPMGNGITSIQKEYGHWLNFNTRINYTISKEENGAMSSKNLSSRRWLVLRQRGWQSFRQTNTVLPDGLLSHSRNRNKA